MAANIGRRISSTKARKELYTLVQSAIEGAAAVQILHRGQQAAVLVNAAEYRRLLSHVRNPIRLCGGLAETLSFTDEFSLSEFAPAPSAQSTPESNSELASRIKYEVSKSFVTDTIPFLLYAGNRHNLLPPGVLSLFEEAVAGRLTIHIPIMVLQDIGSLAAQKLIHLNLPLEDLVAERFFANSIPVAMLELDDVITVNLLDFECDYTSKVAVSMALRMRCPLITANRTIHEAGACRVLWR